MPNASVTLIPGGRGDFIVIADDNELWNKKRVGRFPEHHEIMTQLAA